MLLPYYVEAQTKPPEGAIRLHSLFYLKEIIGIQLGIQNSKIIKKTKKSQKSI